MRIATENGEVGAFEFVDRDDQVVARIEANAPVPASLPAYYRCRLSPRTAHLEADFEFVDESGRLWARVSGWQDQYFSIPHGYYRCRLFPQTELFSTDSPLAVPGVVCRRIDRLPPSFLDDSWGIWKRVLAHLELGLNERRYWYTLPETGPRRAEWLLGRIAAKDAVRVWAAQKHRISLAPADIEILPDDAGKPVVSCRALADLSPAMPQVSISHSLGYTAAAAGGPEQPLGLDIEHIPQGRALDFLANALAPEEIALLGRIDETEKARVMLGFWCAKEAAAKRRGSGLMGDPRLWRVAAMTAEDELLVRFRTESYRVRLWRHDYEILALCLLENRHSFVSDAGIHYTEKSDAV